ncbi:hypothetical protein A4X03_0g9128, partial [Tilletia caries]
MATQERSSRSDPTSVSVSSGSRRAQAALAQCEDMLHLADTVTNLNTSVHQLSDHLEAVRGFVSSVARNSNSLIPSVPRDVASLAEGATAGLRLRVMEQLHERVGQLVQAELDTFSRFVRAVLDGGLRAVHTGQPDGQSILPQPEIDPLGFLFLELEQGSNYPPGSSSTPHPGQNTALEQSRNLNSTLKGRLNAESQLLETVLVAVSNAAGRLGARVNAWTIGLGRVYDHLDRLQKDRNVAVLSEKAAQSAPIGEIGHQHVGRLQERYSSLAQSAIEALLGELVHQVTSHSVDDGTPTSHVDEIDRMAEVAAKAVFGYKVVDNLHQRRSVLRVLVQNDSEATAIPGQRLLAEENIQDALKTTKARCLESWRGLAIDRAVLEHAAAVQESEQRVGIDGDAEPSSMPTALLRAIEALKASV